MLKKELLQRGTTQPEQTIQETKQKKNKAKSIFASIPLSILGALEVHLIYGLTNLVIALVFLILSYIPILKTIVGYFMAIADNTPDIFAMCISTGISYLIFNVTSERIIKKIETRKLTSILVGIYLAVFNILFGIINLTYNDPILGNVLLAILGIVIFYKGKKLKKEE